MTTQHMDGAASIAAERERQKTVECWTADHDDQWTKEQLLRAAILYAETYTQCRAKPFTWPWDAKWWKPKDRRSNLVRAGALIAAEIDRLDRERNWKK